MRYTIGVEIIPKKGNSIRWRHKKGILVSGYLRLKYIHEIGNKSKDIDLIIFDSAKDAETYAQAMSRAYRRDDVWAYDTEKSRVIRKFYPVKIDSSKFPFEITELGNSTKRGFEFNRFNEEQNKPTLTVTYQACKLIPKTTISDKTV